jgi:hypothetical protein
MGINVFSNLDLDDDGVGCESNSAEITVPDSIIQEYDTNKNGKVACSDFEFQIYDTQILAFFPDLDREGDGIGCESNKKPEAYHIVSGTVPAPEDAFFADIDKMEFEIFDEIQEQDPLFDLMSVGGDLMKLLNEDFNKLSGQSIPCSGNILVCFGYNSIAAFGMGAIWFFNFLSGIVVGMAQSISDLVMQIIEMATNAVEVISEMIDGIKQIWNDPSLLLKIFQSSLTEMVQSDTMGRAFLIGKFTVPFIEDALLILLTGGALAIAKNLVTTLKTSQKLGGAVVKISNFVNKTVKFGQNDFSLIVRRFGSGAVGFAGKEVKRLLFYLEDFEFAKFVDSVKDPKLREFLINYRNAIKIIKNYKLTPTGLQHIIDGHAFDSLEIKTSKFLQNEDIPKLIDEALVDKIDLAKISQNPTKNDYFEVLVDMGRTVGRNRQNTKDLSKLRIIVNGSGEVVSAYPK